jgi:FAD/FMN-containing dehydrogenase/Fe-S oxidoreductase
MDTSRYMNQILEINPDEGWVRVQPGVVLDQLNAALAPHRLTFVPNLAPSNRATIGGMINTDASGKGSRVFGKTSHHIMGLSGVTVAGELLSEVDAQLHLKLAEIAATDRKEIDRRFPKLTRFLSGYNLDHATSNGLHSIPILAGSEGSLAIITDATLKLTPIPDFSQLVIIQYGDFLEAVGSAESLLALNPIAIETIDHMVLETAVGDASYAKVAQWILPETRAINLIEFHWDPQIQPDRNCRISASPEEAADWWQLRKKSVGMLARLPGRAKPIPFVEDTVVPPQHLSKFIPQFREILDRHGLRYAMYGHVDVGCIHVRPALDLQDWAHENLVEVITDEVSRLVRHYGGLVWGEHGKGFRTQGVAEVVGPVLYQRMKEIKAIFDPYYQLNPGKIIEVDYTPSPLRAYWDRQIPRPVQDSMPEMMACNGNGACFTVMPSALMCPSYLATGDRMHSPKGRAMMMKEWLRQSEASDFSHEVKAAMDGCLSCKACVSECPVHINIPEMKSQFLEKYHRRHGRPLRDYLVANVESAIRVMRWMPWVGMIVKWAGLVDSPKVAVPSLRRRLPAHYFSGDGDVWIVADAFTAGYAPSVIVAAVTILESMGFSPKILGPVPSGKPALIKGFRAQFRREARRMIALVASVKGPVIGIEPSITTLFSDDYRRLGDLVPMVIPVAQFLDHHRDRLPQWKRPIELTLLSHCMDRGDIAAWTRVIGSVVVPPIGCCGMAGTFGHEREHVAESHTIFDLSWRKAVTAASTPAATGFSCRHQIARFAGRQVLHPLEVMADAL